MNFETLLANSKVASRSSGKGLIAQLLDIVRLRMGSSQLGADDYYLYQLHDQRFSFRDKTQFLGWRRSQDIDRILNSDDWRIYANDKVKFSEAMTAAGLRTPRIHAVFSDSGLTLSGARLLETEEQVRDFFTGNEIYPAFCKPVHGTYGRGGFSALAVDPENGTLTIGDGTTRTLSEVAQQFSEKWAEGYIVQELLTPHSAVEMLIGERLSSLRIVVLQTEQGPQIHRAVWKLPVGHNMSDNFMHGQLGNLIASVEPHSGAVTYVMGMQDDALVEILRHPDTNTNLSGLSVPLWPEIESFCKQASTLFPGLAMQHWDIAICPDGPVALEVNVEGSVDLHQLAGRKGFFDESIQRLIRQHRATSATA